MNTATVRVGGVEQIVNPGVQGFAPIAGLFTNEEMQANTRGFLGDGTEYLRVPGLKKLEAVRVEHQLIPLEMTESYVMDNGGNKKEFTFPLVSLQILPDGCPVLLRHVKSNDGLWQDLATVFVTGEWADDEAYVEPRVVTRDEKIKAAANRKPR